MRWMIMSEVIQGLLLVLAICALIFPTGYILWIWLVRYFENSDADSSSKKKQNMWRVLVL